MPASEWVSTPVQGRLYGGATAFLAGTAIDGAVQLSAGITVASWAGFSVRTNAAEGWYARRRA